MAAISINYGRGGAGLTPNRGSGQPSLAEILRDIATDLEAALGSAAPDWATGVTVTTNVATLAQPGYVIAVEATAGTAAGPKQQVQNGSPAAGQVDVAYDANGIPTLTFNGTDAITACAVVQIARPATYTSRLTTQA